jgi:mRNA interferase MazF
VLSTTLYQSVRPDVIIGLITTRSADAANPTDCDIRDWRSAGLHAPSCFRLYVVTLLQESVRAVGRLADKDWREVQRCLEAGLLPV